MNKKSTEIVLKAMTRRLPGFFWGMLNRSRRKSFFPFKLQFESSALCNIECKMCPRSFMKREQGVLAFDVFKKILNEVRPPYVNLSGLGEPLLNPDIYKIIEYCKRTGVIVKIDTNGTLLSPANIEKLLRTGIDIISISFDSADKETYEAIRVGASFEKVVSNIQNLIQLRNKLQSKTEIQLYFVIQKDNFRQFPKFIDFGVLLGVDSITGGVVGIGTYKPHAMCDINSYKEDDINSLVAELKHRKCNTDVNIEVDEIIRQLNTKSGEINENVPCYKPWYSAFVTWDGFFLPCCYCAVNQDYVIGNAISEDFKNLWNNERHNAIRKNSVLYREGVCSRCGVSEWGLDHIVNHIPFLKWFVNKE